jgi:hypothetical protein
VSSAATAGTVKAVRQQDTRLNLDFEEGVTLEVQTPEPTSSVMVRDKDHRSVGHCGSTIGVSTRALATSTVWKPAPVPAVSPHRASKWLVTARAPVANSGYSPSLDKVSLSCNA